MLNALAKIKRALIKQHYVEFSMVPTLKKKNCIGLAKKFVQVFYNILWKTRMNFLTSPIYESS